MMGKFKHEVEIECGDRYCEANKDICIGYRFFEDDREDYMWCEFFQDEAGNYDLKTEARGKHIRHSSCMQAEKKYNELRSKKECAEEMYEALEKINSAWFLFQAHIHDDCALKKLAEVGRSVNDLPELLKKARREK